MPSSRTRLPPAPRDLLLPLPARLPLRLPPGPRAVVGGSGLGLYDGDLAGRHRDGRQVARFAHGPSVGHGFRRRHELVAYQRSVAASELEGHSVHDGLGRPHGPVRNSLVAVRPNVSDFNTVAQGADDGYYKTLATNLVAWGYGSSSSGLAGSSTPPGWDGASVSRTNGQASWAGDFVPAFRNS